MVHSVPVGGERVFGHSLPAAGCRVRTKRAQRIAARSGTEGTPEDASFGGRTGGPTVRGPLRQGSERAFVSTIRRVRKWANERT